MEPNAPTLLRQTVSGLRSFVDGAIATGE